MDYRCNFLLSCDHICHFFVVYFAEIELYLIDCVVMYVFVISRESVKSCKLIFKGHVARVPGKILFNIMTKRQGEREG